LLVWAYLAFMQYLIFWSDNLPEPVAWYRHRGTGIWSAAEYAIGALHLIPLILLFLTSVRTSRRWLRVVAGSVLVGSSIEIAWLVFPATETEAWLGAAVELLALLALVALSVGFPAWIAQARASRPQRRAP
jgi:heme exporter protein D